MLPGIPALDLEAEATQLSWKGKESTASHKAATEVPGKSPELHASNSWLHLAEPLAAFSNEKGGMEGAA